MTKIHYKPRPLSRNTAYGLQICLGLEASDAELRMIEALAMAAKHDKSFRRLLMRSTHYKSRFCMTKEAPRLLLMQHRFSRNARHALQVPLFQIQTYLHFIRCGRRPSGRDPRVWTPSRSDRRGPFGLRTSVRRIRQCRMHSYSLISFRVCFLIDKSSRNL